MKQYLKQGDTVFCTGCRLYYDAQHNIFRLEGIEEDYYYDGLIVNLDENYKPYIDMVK